MDTLLSMKVFCQVVQSGSFTRAADLLDISIPMASKHVAHLEKNVGAQLLYRNNRSLKLTEQGERYFQDCSTALELLAQAAESAQAGTSKPQGLLRISAPVWFACDHFAHLLHEYQTLYPDVELMLTLTNQRVDLNSDGEDLALRLTHTLADNIIAKPLGKIPFYLAASPSYIAQHGQPTHPDELSQHQAVLQSYVDLSQLSGEYKGQRINLQLNGKIRSNHTQMLASLIRAGAGIGYIPAWLADDDLRAGRLIRLLPDCQMQDPPLYAVYANRQFMKAKVRSFIDFMAQKCQS
ncbi:LysR family transcriptional regulator [Kingella kingae]|uniref:LysR family transcriptional regulator n=2 Tax=Kingella kingae TaxID=504 RepID=F5S4S6_KINKI|nr:LysR family transcriptional regulator [Kingella kingae]EGK11969.1 LysR family transcriptional regulator [Kingella kingae ATCC 23330]MDK4534403.1 LysR family transcriptional regulator [Kingella kingae]MDK4540937.1 LysR family transcriptional regulator [Kingella kingae]MDK4553445.1 LysR family transcriptional regulator [Kingella kingae]UOP03450.1 LysR family transcriptional regulator [Kingella kingae]